MTRGRSVGLAFAALTLVIGLAPAAKADIVLEGVQAARCSEGGIVRLPKKMTFYQAITTREFESFESVSLVLWSALSNRPDLSDGKVVATVRQVKPDGTEILLGKVGSRFRAGQAEKEKAVSARLESGDLIEWRLKLKQLPPLETFLECWWVELSLGGAQMLQ